ncbi:MAG: hypothetical protein K5864_02170 [Bacteroidales bacterium]|nr:hypothetical protein [Bacteroidales bacterium]
MNNDVSRDLRAEQIAATILYRYFGNISISGSTNQLYDLLVSYNDGTELKFGVEVKRQKDVPLNMGSLIAKINGLDLSERSNRIPIILLYVNEETEVAKVGFLVGWRYGKPQIYRDFELRILNEKTSGLCLQLIKSMDEVIRVLSLDDLHVMKRIVFSRSIEKGRRQQAEVLYLRKMSSEYRMKQKEVVDERERLERLIKGTPQEEYPDDELDRIIYDAITEKFSNAKKKNSLLILSTELAELQSYKQWHCHKTKLLVTPNLTNVPQSLLCMLNGLELFGVDVEIYVENVFYQDAFDYVSFEKVEPIDGWLKKVTEWNMLKETFSPISMYFR